MMCLDIIHNGEHHEAIGDKLERNLKLLSVLNNNYDDILKFLKIIKNNRISFHKTSTKYLYADKKYDKFPKIFDMLNIKYDVISDYKGFNLYTTDNLNDFYEKFFSIVNDVNVSSKFSIKTMNKGSKFSIICSDLPF